MSRRIILFVPITRVIPAPVKSITSERSRFKRVLECVQGTLTYVRLFRDDFTQEMLAQDKISRKTALTQNQKVLSGAQKRMENLDKIIQRLYEDSVLGKLSDLRFQKLSARYETELRDLPFLWNVKLKMKLGR